MREAKETLLIMCCVCGADGTKFCMWGLFVVGGYRFQQIMGQSVLLVCGCGGTIG